LKLQEIKNELDEISLKILEYSFKNLVKLEELTEIYSRIVRIRNEFLQNNFMEIEIQELEQTRFSLAENLLNIKILIKEHIGQDAGNEINKLKELCEKSEVE
jgi:hypothetical protein